LHYTQCTSVDPYYACTTAAHFRCGMASAASCSYSGAAALAPSVRMATLPRLCRKLLFAHSRSAPRQNGLSSRSRTPLARLAGGSCQRHAAPWLISGMALCMRSSRCMQHQPARAASASALAPSRRCNSRGTSSASAVAVLRAQNSASFLAEKIKVSVDFGPPARLRLWHTRASSLTPRCARNAHAPP